MAVQTRAIKRRIKSVKNTRKITKAMEMVAASKMRKAVNAVLGTRPYAQLAWNTVLSIGQKVDTQLHPLLAQPEEVRRVLIVLITSDRGLAGGYNTNMIRSVKEVIDGFDDEVQVETVCLGKRGADAMRRMKVPILASFTELTNKPAFEDVLPIGRMVIDEYTQGRFDRVLLAYTDFQSALSQVPVVLDLLPLSRPEEVKELGAVKGEEMSVTVDEREYAFEPSPQAVLDQILPRLVETMMYQAVLEGAASEHSARMMAMRSATDAAGDMLEELTFTYNQARQAGITQEIAEISSGKAALEGSR